ncbi:MAG: SDR family NAD(P)-dependent oxidoreductase [Vicinamibacterales bacterium]
MRLEGTTALVTGAGRGLGWGAARALARAGAHVVLTAEQPDELEAARVGIVARGGSAEAIVADLRTAAGCDALVAAMRRSHATLQLLVNNAGVLRLVDVRATTDAVWDETIAVNLTAPFRLLRATIDLMPAGGSIVNVSSRAGVMPFASEAAYCAAKFGIEGLTRAAAIDLEGTRISVNTVTPGLRIKPTGVTLRDFDALPAPERDSFHDPETLGPAFIALATLRGRPSGRRFDARRLAEAIATRGYEAVLADLEALAEPSARDA